MLLMSKLYEVHVLTLFNIVIVDNDDWRAFLDLSTKLAVVFLLDFNHGVRLLDRLSSDL